MHILAQLSDVLKPIFSVGLARCTCRAEYPLLGFAPVRVPYVMAQIRVASTAYHAAIVKGHVVEVQALVLDLRIADGTRVRPSWYEDSSFGGLIPRCLLFQTGVEGIDLGEKLGEATGGPRFAFELQGPLETDPD
jgi:hypothetical protein